jgi:N-acetylglucosaminyldiphosphoundecaprenol N-acetyl-beta-D-mannosaminyltransferase
MAQELEALDNSFAALDRPLESRFIVGMRVDATSYRDATDRIMAWAKNGESRMVCAASVNNVMETRESGDFLDTMNRADLVTPDGMPLVWGLKLLGVKGPTRTYGPSLTEILFDRAEVSGVPVGFYGGTPEVLDDLLEIVGRRWPELKVTYAYSPPFRSLTAEERQREVADINASGARLLFVGIGSPKQDRWMDSNKNQIGAVMLGVGAAFDFIAGVKNQAPSILQRLGLEWFFRLLSEPRRLWRRYLVRNPRFLYHFGLQLVRARAEGRGRA